MLETTAERIIHIRDQRFPSDTYETFQMPQPGQTLLARDLIAERLRYEAAKRAQAKQDAYCNQDDRPCQAPLMPVPFIELLLNGPRRTGLASTEGSDTDQPLDEKIQTALKAFEDNAFLLLVDETQIETLDTEIVLTPGSIVTFIQLIPLVGG